MRVAICFALLTIFGVQPVAAQTASDPGAMPEAAACRGGPGATLDSRLAACNAVIAGFEPRGGSSFAEFFTIRCSLRLDKDDGDGAIADCSRAIELDPKNLAPYHTRAVAYLSKKDFDRAVADCDYLIQHGKATPGIYTLRGIIHSEKGDYDAAIGDFEQALKLNPSLSMAQSGLADAKQAKAQLAAGQKPGDMRAWCDGKALPQEGFGGDLQIKGCTALIESGKETAADLPRDYFNRASAYDFAREYDKAVADLSQAVRLKPDFGEAWYRRGAIRWVKKDYDGAISDLTKAIELDPKQSASYADRGYAYLAKGKFDLAVADFEKILALEPDNPDAYLNICRARIGKGEYDKAIAACDLAIKHSRTSEATEGFNGRGDAHLLKGDFAAAIADYDEALNRWPDYPEAFYGRGLAKIKKGDAAGGKADIEEARKRDAGIAVSEAGLGIKP